jgi:hypothetical protein
VIDILLVGAPGSGKTDLAFDLATALDQGEEFYSIVDEYAEDVRDQSNLAIGPYAGYIGNFLIAAERLKREVGHFKRGEPYIVCGSLVETIVYFSVNGTSTPTDAVSYRKINTFMQMLGMTLVDMYAYGVCLYLPVPEDHENFLLSQEIGTALSTLQVPYARLSEEDRLEQALGLIRQAEAELDVAEAKQRGVRAGGSDGEDDGDAPVTVPDVPEHGADGQSD